MDVLLSQDCRCHRCQCPGEHRLAVISCLFNTPVPKVMISQCGLPHFYQDVHLSFTCSAKRELMKIFCVSLRLRRLQILFRSCILSPRSCHLTGEWPPYGMRQDTVKPGEGISMITKSFPPTDLLMSRQKLQVRWMKEMNKTIVCCSICYIYIKMPLWRLLCNDNHK